MPMKKDKRKRDDEDSFDVMQMELPERSQFEKQIEIDRDGLDDCLIQHAELHHKVADAAALAVARRDWLKKRVEEVEAEEDNRIRATAERNEEKITEPFVKKQIAGSDKVSAANKEYLYAKLEADRWAALRDAGFEQRSYMLKLLVSMYLSRLSGASVGTAYGDMAEVNRARAGAERNRRRRG